MNGRPLSKVLGLDIRFLGNKELSRVCVCVRACGCAGVRAGMHTYVSACVLACVNARVTLRTNMRTCVRRIAMCVLHCVSCILDLESNFFNFVYIMHPTLAGASKPRHVFASG